MAKSGHMPGKEPEEIQPDETHHGKLTTKAQKSLRSPPIL